MSDGREPFGRRRRGKVSSENARRRIVSLGLVFVAELGDKSQLMTVDTAGAPASRVRPRPHSCSSGSGGCPTAHWGGWRRRRPARFAGHRRSHRLTLRRSNRGTKDPDPPFGYPGPRDRPAFRARGANACHLPVSFFLRGAGGTPWRRRSKRRNPLLRRHVPLPTILLAARLRSAAETPTRGFAADPLLFASPHRRLAVSARHEDAATRSIGRRDGKAG